MNKELLLKWLTSDAEKRAPWYASARRELELEKALLEVNTWRDIGLPSALPKKPEGMLRTLKAHFHGKVTFISLVLSYYFPDQFLYYRVSRLDREIVEGLAYFGEIVPEFRLEFSAVGETGLERYWQLNKAVQAYAGRAWPDPRVRQAAALAFLYDGLGRLFLDKSDYNRYWFMVTKPDYWDSLDQASEIRWSGRKEMKAGDLVFMYRTMPHKAITNLYRVKAEPEFDPWAGWQGFWVDLVSLGSISDIAFADMRSDPVIQKWSAVRRQFQGMQTEVVPHSVYNELWERIPPQIRKKHDLKREPVLDVGSSGQFTSEAEFEEQIVKPLIRRWGLQFEYQYPCLFHLGSQETHGRVDCFVKDARGPITLFENKVRIANAEERALAVAQAKSYALMLGLPSFVIAAPEELRVYSLRWSEHTEECYVPGDQLAAQEENVRNVLMRLRI